MKIKLGVPSKRAYIYEFQASYFALAIRGLESAFFLKFRKGERITFEGFEIFRDFPEYAHFHEAAMVSGFVCSDFSGYYPFEALHEAPSERVPEMTLSDIRHYIHTLHAAGRFSSEYNETLWNAIASGALDIVASRLEGDPSIYQQRASESRQETPPN